MCSAFQVSANRLLAKRSTCRSWVASLPEEVVDPVDLRLVQHLVHGLVQLAEVLRRGAERLLVDDPGTFGQVVPAEGAVSSGKATGGTAR